MDSIPNDQNSFVTSVVTVIKDLVAILKITFVYIVKCLIDLVLRREKSLENKIVLITGSGGYLGK